MSAPFRRVAQLQGVLSPPPPPILHAAATSSSARPTLDLYSAPTPNGWKISIFLEEAGLPYNYVHVDLLKGDQHSPEFLEISPNGRIPAILDRNPDARLDARTPSVDERPDGDDAKGARLRTARSPGGLSVFESGAILLYLARKTE